MPALALELKQILGDGLQKSFLAIGKMNWTKGSVAADVTK
jgi:hypothetical protein